MSLSVVSQFNNATVYIDGCQSQFQAVSTIHSILLGTSCEREDKVVARKLSESIQDYNLQRDACI
jgi:hypothetical protein